MKKILLFIILLTSLNFGQSGKLILFDYDADTTGYWVDAVNGSDTYAGNYSYPYKTMSKATLTATAGSTVKVKAGTYTESTSGVGYLNMSQQLDWVAKGEVIVKSTGAQVVRLAGTNQITMTGFIFDGETTKIGVDVVAGTTNKSIIGCTIRNTTQGYRTSTGSSNLAVTNCTFNTTAGAGNSAIFVRSAITIDGCTFTNINSSYLLYSYSHTATVVFSNNIATHSGALQCIWMRSNNTLTLSGNTITLANATPYNFIKVGDEPKTTAVLNVTNNTFTTANKTSTPLFSFNAAGEVVDINFTGNTINANSTTQLQSIVTIVDKPSATITNNIFNVNSDTTVTSIDITASTGNSKFANISGNTFYSKSKYGYIVKIGAEATGALDNKCDSATIHNNTIYGARYYNADLANYSTHDIFVGHNYGASIKYNKIYGGGYGILLKATGQADSTSIIAYNLIKDCFVAIYKKGSPKGSVYNNTIYATNLDNHIGIYLAENTTNDSSSYVHVKNNLIYTESDVTNNSLISVDSSSSIGADINYNCYYYLGTSSFVIDETAYSSFAAYQGSGNDANGLNINPEFTSATDFSLQATSGCINAGVDVGLTDDILGNVIVGAPDIGAYEYQP